MSAVTVTYRDGTRELTQTFAHDLTVCGGARQACSAVGTETVAVDTAAAANARCRGTTTSWASGRPERAWLATDLSSIWVGSGGTITWTKTTKASYGVSQSADFSVAVDTLFASVQATYGISVTKEFSTSSTWSYDLTLPRDAPMSRATVYVYAWIQPATTAVTRSRGRTCETVYSYGVVYAPDRDTDPHRDYCIALEPYPGRPDLGPTCHSGGA